MSETKPFLLSVRLMTYNHEAFILEAMKSVDAQQTNFDFEVVVGDDFSTDRTAEIFAGFESENPRAHWKVIQREKGDAYHIARQQNGRVQNFYDILQKCSGKYIALLDGDDYWTDPKKLQKQVNLLEQYPELAGCFHNSIVVNAKSEMTYDRYYEGVDGSRHDQEDSVTNLRSAYSTGSLVYRNEAMQPHMEEFLKIGTDFILEVMITNYGDLQFIDQNMSAYRFHEGGVWQGNTMQKNRMEVAARYLFLFNTEPYRSRYNKLLWNRVMEIYDELLVRSRDTAFKEEIKAKIDDFLDYSELRTYGYLWKRLLRSLHYRRKMLLNRPGN